MLLSLVAERTGAGTSATSNLMMVCACADRDSMAQFWQCCKRTGLPEKDALALLGFHPCARSWAEPQAAEQRSAADQPRFSNAFFRFVFVGVSCPNMLVLILVHVWEDC